MVNGVWVYNTKSEINNNLNHHNNIIEDVITVFWTSAAIL